MGDELTHIRNLEEERRRSILAAHKKYMDSLFIRYPELKKNYEQVETVQRKIISATLGKLQGQPQAEEIFDLETRLEELREERSAFLSRQGIEPASMMPKWNCPHCQDTGMILRDGRYTPCPCSAARRLQLFRRQAGLPLRIAEVTFEQVKFEVFPAEYRSQAKRIYAYVQGFSYNRLGLSAAITVSLTLIAMVFSKAFTTIRERGRY